MDLEQERAGEASDRRLVGALLAFDDLVDRSVIYSEGGDLVVFEDLGGRTRVTLIGNMGALETRDRLAAPARGRLTVGR